MYKQKLIDLLKSDEQTKTAMEKLEFGCKIIIDNNSSTGLKATIRDTNNSINGFVFWACELSGYFYIKELKKIIGLPLSERFLRMYCKNKGIWFLQNGLGVICLDNKYYIELNETKDLDNQSEEFYEQLLKALLQLNKDLGQKK